VTIQWVFDAVMRIAKCRNKALVTRAHCNPLVIPTKAGIQGNSRKRAINRSAAMAAIQAIRAATPALKIHPADAVAVALQDLPAGFVMTELAITILENIPRGHKFAVHAVTAGSPVRKYGQVIGTATQDIAAGAHVHVHNLRFDTQSLDTRLPEAPVAPSHNRALQARTFMGYQRADGQIGTRNYVGILTTVNCAATVAKQIARRFEDASDRFPNVDGVIALTHTSGCGMAHEGDGIDILRRTVAGYAQQANFAGVLLIGLGCEVNQSKTLLHQYGLQAKERFRVLEIQASGGTKAAIEQGIAEMEQLLTLANSDLRTPQPLSALSLALQCGGSDGWSGITANPALGAAADLLLAAGGSVVLSETPEIYGAESLLYARAASPEVAKKLADRLRWWEGYAAKHNTDLNNNPSPGNIAGGLTTILEKSLGAVAKSGRGTLVDVLRYGERMRLPGFQFMDTPGYDPCSATGQIAGGCNVMAFTTGRGAVFGAKPVPSIKLASNSQLAARQAEDIDVDCGGIAEGRLSVEAAGLQVFEKLIAIASGERSASELLGFGEAEFVPWQIGAVM
jgi:altronate hydrolase